MNQKQIEEINVIIKDIEKEVKPGMEIGARDRTTLAALLSTNKIEKRPKYFKCKKEYSQAILQHFTKEKALTRNKFSMNAQAFIYLI
ncbi:MAG: hypothetical protein ABIS36_18990 [Chryseolinea sp.]